MYSGPSNLKISVFQWFVVINWKSLLNCFVLFCIFVNFTLCCLLFVHCWISLIVQLRTFENCGFFCKIYYFIYFFVGEFLRYFWFHRRLLLFFYDFFVRERTRTAWICYFEENKQCLFQRNTFGLFTSYSLFFHNRWRTNTHIFLTMNATCSRNCTFFVYYSKVLCSQQRTISYSSLLINKYDR